MLSGECETARVPRTIRLIKQVEFNADEPSEIVGYMRLLSEAGDGWINVMPEKDAAESTGTLGFFTLFGGGSSGITMCTWKPVREGQRGSRHVSVGITHTTGRRVRTQLTSLAIPESWGVMQDHPQRGMVLSIPDGEPHEQVLAWALGVLRALSPFAHDGSWRADVYLPASS